MDKSALISVLKSEIEQSTGCTDPGSVALAASRARRELGRRPERIKVTVSPNVYKNGISVGIPGTGKRGLHLAAALGALIDKHEMGLAIFTYVTPELIDRANSMLSAGTVTVEYAEVPDPLYIKAEVFCADESAYAVVMNDYSNIAEVGRNGEITFQSDTKRINETQDILKNHSLRELYCLIEDMSLSDLEFLIDYALINKKAAEEGLGNANTRLGRLLNERASMLKGQLAVANRAQVFTAAAGEARMLGLNIPIMAIAGSGNHGITNFLGILAVAEQIKASTDRLAKALAISSTVTVYIKRYLKRMTAFCGCAVAAATGVAAGVVHLLGGGYEESVHAMQSVVGTLAGMFCDGAKESCAYKLSTAAATAVQFAYLAMEGCYIPASSGIVGPTIEDTFRDLGILNNPGMLETDRILVSLIERNLGGQAKQSCGDV